MIKMKGEYTFEKFVNNELVDTVKFDNIVTNAIYEYILKSLNGESVTGINLSHFAFGTGTTTPEITNTTLGTEVYRKGFTSKSWSTNQFTAICQLATDEGNYSITEVGVFSNASLTTDSGTLLSHALKTIEKNSNITYNIIYRLTLTEV